LLKKKDFLDLKNMKEIKFSELETLSDYNKKTFLYDFLSSMRQKVSDPLGKRKKK
jgi:hypothetical protein